MTVSIISNEEMDDIMGILKSLQFFNKNVSKTIKNEAKEQKGAFLACC